MSDAPKEEKPDAGPKQYKVLEDGFVHGLWQKKNDKLTLTDAQANMFLAHGRIALIKTDPKKG